MSFPPPLVPHINCEPRPPLPTERWDWVVCRNALWTAVSAVLFLPEGKKDVTPRIGPRKGDSCIVLRASIPRRGPSRHPLVTISETNHSIFVNFGKLSAPLISAVRRPAPRPPFGDGSWWPEGPTLGPCHRPSYNPLTIHLLSLIFACRYFGVSAQLQAPRRRHQLDFDAQSRQVHGACSRLPPWQSSRDPKPYVMYSLQHCVNLSRRACTAGLILLWLVGISLAYPKPPDHASDTVMHPPVNRGVNTKDISSLYVGTTVDTTGNAVPEETTTSMMTNPTPKEPKKKEVERYPVLSVSFYRVEIPFIIGLWIFCASLAKIGEFTTIT
ncbi:hypothetical protein GEV33_007215 [Tenebrio molitor]|uniref:Uncharacterized protein n=1 Tax=Tenebrio molitor TaxID=7067 RepID=A0A8J6HB58_TENMO|nr:hypothetical protein GEV33_007215 [Tenebrio molitor]